MKERGIGEYAIKSVLRQVKFQEVLFPDPISPFLCHANETRGAFQANGNVPQLFKRFEIATWPTAKIKYREGRLALHVLK